jgi:hypothetical protein
MERTTIVLVKFHPAVPDGTAQVQTHTPITGVPVFRTGPRSGNFTIRTGAYRTDLRLPFGVSFPRPQRKVNESGLIVISASWKSVTTTPVNCVPARGCLLGRHIVYASGSAFGRGSAEGTIVIPIATIPAATPVRKRPTARVYGVRVRKRLIQAVGLSSCRPAPAGVLFARLLTRSMPESSLVPFVPKPAERRDTRGSLTETTTQDALTLLAAFVEREPTRARPRRFEAASASIEVKRRWLRFECE